MPEVEAELARILPPLRAQAETVGCQVSWPVDSWALLARHDVLRWFVPREFGGWDWPDEALLRGYVGLASACLTTTFILTQWAAAVRRIVVGHSASARELLPEIAAGRRHVTVGISHLTTSHRHWAKPVLQAKETGDGFLLNGFSPWVTGAARSQTIVTGAVLPDRRQVLLAVPATLPGITAEPFQPLVALTGSETGRVAFQDVCVERRWLVDGPAEQVLAGAGQGGAGGSATSALALGLAQAAVDFLEEESRQREELRDSAARLRREQTALAQQLNAVAKGETVDLAVLRSGANSLVLRATQAALAAAKGAGFVQGHRVGRWCREALFFLVWSCPQPVLQANLCELSGGWSS